MPHLISFNTLIIILDIILYNLLVNEPNNDLVKFNKFVKFSIAPL